jgi:hypothetical protein
MALPKISVVNINGDRVDVPNNVWLEISEAKRVDDDSRDVRHLIRSDEVDRRMYSMLDTEVDYSDLDREEMTKAQFRWEVYKALTELKQRMIFNEKSSERREIVEKNRSDRLKVAVEDVMEMVR